MVRGSVVGRVEPALITRVASALRCTPGQPRPPRYGSEEWDADSGASAMMSNSKEGMYNIRYPTDQYIQIGDSGFIRVEAIGDVNSVFHQLDEHGDPEDVVACAQDVIYTPWLGFNFFSIWKVFCKPHWYTSGKPPLHSGIGERLPLRHPTPPSSVASGCSE